MTTMEHAEKAIQEIHGIAEAIRILANQIQADADTTVPLSTDPLLIPEHLRIRKEWNRTAQILTAAVEELKGQTVGERLIAMALGLKLRADPPVTPKPERKLTLIQGGKS